MTRIEQYIGGQLHDFQDLEYDLANRLWKKCRVSYQNDANGNRTSRTLDSKVLNYLYDGENRLTQVTKNGVDVLDNVYDGSGMRIKEVKGGQTTYFVVQGNNPLLEYTPSDGKYKYFIYAGNKMVAEETDGVVKYFYGDHLGSTKIVSDAAGNKVAEYKFRPFGETDSTSGAFSTNYRFTGKPSNDEVGLSYFGARFYDPEVGRFITVDPARQGLNWYSYCQDNPLRYVDPDGKEAIDWVQGGLDAVGLVPGFGEIADGVNAVISLCRGDLLTAGLSAAAMIPFAGWGATAGKVAVKALRYGDKVVNVVSSIKRSKILVNAAEQMGKNKIANNEANKLLEKLFAGNVNPGKGTNNLFKDICYLRGDSGCRVFYRVTEDGIEILGKSNKKNEQKVIDELMRLYGK